MKRAEYNKPEIRSEAIDIGVYGQYMNPVPGMAGSMGLCTCPP